MYDKRATTSRWEAVCRRAGGRRHDNAVRQFLALRRLREVVDLLVKIGMSRGYQSRVAEALGVSRATICRDMARLRRGTTPATEAEKMHRELAKLDRRARAEDKGEVAYDRPGRPVDPVVVAADPVAARPVSHIQQTFSGEWVDAWAIRRHTIAHGRFLSNEYGHVRRNAYPRQD
ncbi:MAG: hypothetical protein ACYC3X_28920 [Pirellulaceae bacterium]